VKALAAVDVPLLAGMLTVIALAAWGLRAAYSPSGRSRVSILTACAALIVQSAIFARFTADDAYITFRYSRNWASGLGPVFQPGERVEGYTSFLQMGLLALAHRFGIDIELASKVIGIIASLAAVVAVSVLTRRLGAGNRAAKIAPILLSLAPLNAAWTFGGLDAPLFAAVLCWAACLLLAEWRQPAAWPWSGLMFGILVLVRPEGILFASVALVTRLLSREPAGNRTKRLLIWCLAFAVIAVPYWLWRWHYYGAFFPNTFYAKTTLSLGRVVHGVISVSDFFAEVGLLQLLLFLLAASAVLTARAEFRFVLAAIASFLAYLVVIGGDVQFLRFYVHILPLWTACIAIGLDRVLRAVEGSKPDPSPARAWAIAFAIAAPWGLCAYQEYASALEPEPHNRSGASTIVDVYTHIHRAHAQLGEWLRVHAPRQSHVAITDLGIIAYRCNLPMIDLYGLTDQRIARLIHARAGVHALAAELRARNPEFLVLYGASNGANLGSMEDDRQWINDAYRPHSFWPDSKFDKGLVLLVRKDVQVAAVSPPGRALHAVALAPDQYKGF
jgi:hypothetical protein